MKPVILIIALLVLCSASVFAVTQDPAAISIQFCTVVDANGGGTAVCADVVTVTCNVTAVGGGDAKIKSVQYTLGNGVLLSPVCITPSTCTTSGSANALWSANYTVGSKDNGFTVVQLKTASATSTSGAVCSGDATTSTGCYVQFNVSSVPASCVCSSTVTTGAAQRDNTAVVTTRPSAGCGDVTPITTTRFADYCDPHWVASVSVCGGVNRTILNAQNYENVKGTLVKTYDASDGGRCCASTAQQAGHLWFNHNTGSDCDAPVDDAASLTCYLDAWPGFQRGDAATGSTSSHSFGQEGYVAHTSSIQSFWQPLAADVDNDGNIEVVVGSPTYLTVATKDAAVKYQVGANVVAQPAIWGITTPSTVLGGENPVNYASAASANGSLIVVPVLSAGTYYVNVYSADLSTLVYSKNFGANPVSGVSCDLNSCYWMAQVGTGVFGYVLNMSDGTYASGPFMLMQDSAVSGGYYTGVWSVIKTSLSFSPRDVPTFMDDPRDPSKKLIVWTQYDFQISGSVSSVLLTGADGTPVRRFGVGSNYLTMQTNYTMRGPFIYNRADGGLYVTTEEHYIDMSNNSKMQLALVRVQPSVANLDAGASVSSANNAGFVTPVWDARSTTATEGISNVAINEVGHPVFKTFTLTNSDPLQQGAPTFALPTVISTMPTLNPFGFSAADNPKFLSMSPQENSLYVQTGPTGSPANTVQGWNYNLGTKANTGSGGSTYSLTGVDWAHNVFSMWNPASCGGYFGDNPAYASFYSFSDFGSAPRQLVESGGLTYSPQGSCGGGMPPALWLVSGTSFLVQPLSSAALYEADGTWGNTGWNATNISSKTPVTSSLQVSGVYHPSYYEIGGLLNQLGPFYNEDGNALSTSNLFSGYSHARFVNTCRFNGYVNNPKFVCDDGKKYKYTSLTGSYTVTTNSCSADFTPLMYNSDRAILGYLRKTRNDGLNRSTPGPELVYCDFSNEQIPVLTHTGQYLPPATQTSTSNASGNYTQWYVNLYYQRRSDLVYNNFDRVAIYGRDLTTPSGNKTLSQLLSANSVLYLYQFDMTTEAPSDSTSVAVTKTSEMQYDPATHRMYTTRGVISQFVQKSYQTMADLDNDGGYESISGRSVDSLTSGVSRNFTFSPAQDSWTIPVDLNSDGAIDVASAGRSDFLTTYVSNPSVSALTSGPPSIKSLRCAVTPNSGLTNVQIIGSLSNPGDAQVVLDPGDGTGSYFPDISLNGLYQYAYGSSGNYTIKVQLFGSQNVFNISEATCDVSVTLPSSQQTGSTCSLGLDGEFSFSDDVVKHGWLYDGGTLAPSSGIVGVNSGRLLQHNVAGCDRTIQTVEFKVGVNDGDLKVLSGNSQIGGVSFDTTVKTIRDMNGRSLGVSVVKGQDMTIRVVVDKEKNSVYVYSGDGSLLSTSNITGTVTGVMVRGPMTVDYARVSQSGGVVIGGPNGTENISLAGDKLKLKGCAVSNIGNSEARDVRMSYPNVGSYCNTVPGKRCTLDNLVEIVTAAPSCSKEAYNYCIVVAIPGVTKTAGIENQSTTIQGATTCSALLTGSSLWGGVVSPTASVFWTMITSNGTVFILVIVLLVLVLPLYIKGKGR